MNTAMNKKEAAAAWHVSVKEVKRICRHMQLDPNAIPGDARPVYVPDKRTASDPHRFYAYALTVINNPVLRLEGVDPLILESCVTQLSKAGLIVPKQGADPESTDYRDYVISADRQRFYDWSGKRAREELGML